MIISSVNPRNPLLPQTGQGPARPADAEDLERDKIGFTHPNLHRRIDPQEPKADSGECRPADHILSINGLNSYHTIIRHTHDEDSNSSEIP